MTPEPAKIRVLHVITGLSTGGAEMMLLKLLSATRDNHPQAVVSLKDEGTIGPRIRDLGVPVYALGLRPTFPNPLRAFSIRSIVRRFRPDIIQGWMYHGNLMASFASITSRSRPPVLWGVHQSVREVSDFGRLTALAIRLGAVSSRNPARIVYVSRTGARQHEALGYQPGGRIIMPNGIDCATFHPDDEARRQVRAELGIATESLLVGLVARYHPMKDHSGFLSAAAQLVHLYPSLRFLLIGKGVTNDQPEIQKVICQHHLQDYIFLLGERQDTPRLTAALDIACSASAWGEAFSIVVGEAMACGVPCVVTDVGDSAYLVGDTGLSVPPSQPQALAGAIGHFIEAGIDYRRRLGLAARQRIEKEFSLPAIARRYEELYRELICEKRVITTLPAATPLIDSIQGSGERTLALSDAELGRPRIAAASPARVRVLHVITGLDIGGAQMMLLKLLSAAREREAQAVVSLKDEGAIGPQIKELGTPVYGLRLRSAAPNLLRTLSIRSVVRQFRPHLIQGWMYHGNLMASLAGALSQDNVQVLWNIRQALEDIAAYKWKTAATIRLGARLSSRPAAVIYNSRSGAKHHEAFGFHNAIEIVIPNGFDCERFRPDEDARNRIRGELGLMNGTVLIGLVARYDPIKGHRGFLRAAGLVAAEHSNVRFVLVGKGVTPQEPELRQAIAEEQLQERVFLLGERLDVERVTCAFDIACSASLSEGFSNAIGEAMSCGVPCVVTDVGDSAYLVSDTGVSISSRSPEATAERMADGINRLIAAGPDYRRQLGLAARRRVESQFSLSAIADRYEDVYRQLCRKSGRPLKG